jgi:hypothetical protein
MQDYCVYRMHGSAVASAIMVWHYKTFPVTVHNVDHVNTKTPVTIVIFLVPQTHSLQVELDNAEHI